MKQNDELVVNIEKFSNLGTGIAKVDGQVVFVENACPDDVVKIKNHQSEQKLCYDKNSWSHYTLTPQG